MVNPDRTIPSRGAPFNDPYPLARPPLTRARALEGAVALADRIGIEAFTIRRLADELDVKPMTLYHHVENKDAILDGMVDAVFVEIDLRPWSWTGARPSAGGPCQPARCWPGTVGAAAHGVAHLPGPATLADHDAVLGCLRRGGRRSS